MPHIIIRSAIVLAAWALMGATPAWGARKADPQVRRVPYPDGQYSLYRVHLTDKHGTRGQLSRPGEFLSARALERRRRQGIAVDSTDLPVSAAHTAALARAGFPVVGASRWNNTVLVRLPRRGAERDIEALPMVRRAVRVFSTPDSVDVIVPDAVDSDPTADIELPCDEYGAASRQIDLLHGQPLHRAGFRGRGMLIAVIDGGFMNADRLPLLQGVDVVARRDCVYPYNADLHQLLDHGTKVLSTMAMRRDSVFIGTAPEASYALLRSEDGRTEMPVEEDYWAMAAEAADSIGADVVNSSLGYTAFDEPEMNHSYREQDGRTTLISRTAAMMAGKGMVLVSSAGNEGVKSWKRTNFPADADDILAVAAIDNHGVNATFSSVGPTADMRIKPDVASMGVSSTVVCGSGRVSWANGTSFAAPELCGMVACLWQALPGKTAREIIDIVRRAGDRADHPDTVYGYGVPDFWRAYQENKF